MENTWIPVWNVIRFKRRIWSEVGSRKSEVGSRKSEVGSRKSEVGSWKFEVGKGKRDFRLSFHYFYFPTSNFRLENDML